MSGNWLSVVAVIAFAHVPDLNDAIGVTAADQRVLILELDGSHTAVGYCRRTEKIIDKQLIDIFWRELLQDP